MLKTLTFSIALTLSISSFAQPGRGYKEIIIDDKYEHTKWATSPSDIIYEFGAFTSSFDSQDDNNGDGKGDNWGIPEWVSYEIKKTPNQTEEGKKPRKWLTDDNLLEEKVAPNDASYHVKGSNSIDELGRDSRYVRGHLCMRLIARRVGLNAEYNSHTVLNAVPQLQWQNAGLWQQLEYETIKWAEKHERVWVITGPVFYGKNPSVWLGQQGEVPVAVPEGLFKIVIKEVNGKPDALAFLIPNRLKSEIDRDDYHLYLTSVDRIEELTGLDFMSNTNGINSMERRNADLTDNEKERQVASW